MSRARGRCVRSVAVLLVVVLVAAGCRPPSQLAVEVWIPGLHKPWDIAFTPDGTLLFTERRGTVNAFVDGSVRELAWPSDVIVNWEAGMMGIAVDPDFASNRRIYTCLVSSLGAPRDVRVVRWVVDAGMTTLTDRTDILTGIPIEPGLLIAHVGCRPRFGPDGALWVTTGDGRAPTAAQDVQSLAGKVLRIDTDGGPAAGNPGAPLAPEVYTYGHRNPQGIAFSPIDGAPYTAEHGPTCDDEVNRLVAGANYGWDPQQPGGGGPYNEAAPMTDLVEFPAARPAIWSSGCPTIAPSGVGFLTGPQWAGWQSALAVAVLKGQQLRIMRFGADGAFFDDAVPITDQGRLRVAVQGPDGNLYLAVDADPGSILRVVPTP